MPRVAETGRAGPKKGGRKDVAGGGGLGIGWARASRMPVICPVLRAIDAVVDEACAFDLPLVEVTGGEPLAQRQAIPLMERLVARGRTVLLETSGSRDISRVPPEVHIILDLKPPDSGEERANLWANLPLLRAKDEVKFVLASRRDYEWARAVLAEHRLDAVCAVLFSPVFGSLSPQDLVAWILADRLPVRFQLQMHKQIWPAAERGV